MCLLIIKIFNLMMYPYVYSGDDDVEFHPPLSSRKRKSNHREVNDEPQKRTKRKLYRPKVVSQLSKRREKSQPKSTNSTPKPSTPKQRKSYVRKAPKCKRSLSLFVGEDSISLPFLKNSNGSKVEQDGFENTTIKNELGIGYNSLQSYQNITSLSCLYLVESRRSGVSFPKMCKKKRYGRPRLVKLLIPFVKGKRSKSFVRKKKCWKHFILKENYKISKKMRLIIKKIFSLKKKKSQKNDELVVHTNQLVVHKKSLHKKSGELVPYKRPSLGVDVILDEETLRVWNLLTDERGHEEDDEGKQRYWEEIRRNYRYLVESFISRMHFIQGMLSS